MQGRLGLVGTRRTTRVFAHLDESSAVHQKRYGHARLSRVPASILLGNEPLRRWIVPERSIPGPDLHEPDSTFGNDSTMVSTFF